MPSCGRSGRPGRNRKGNEFHSVYEHGFIAIDRSPLQAYCSSVLVRFPSEPGRRPQPFSVQDSFETYRRPPFCPALISGEREERMLKRSFIEKWKATMKIFAAMLGMGVFRMVAEHYGYGPLRGADIFLWALIFLPVSASYAFLWALW